MSPNSHSTALVEEEVAFTVQVPPSVAEALTPEKLPDT
jgi:hypothetical protein